MSTDTHVTRGGITVRRTVDDVAVAGAIEPLLEALDQHRGVLLASSYEYPGRYTRWDIGFIDPPLVLTSRGREFRVTALNPRGAVLLGRVATVVRGLPAVASVDLRETELVGTVRAPVYKYVDNSSITEIYHSIHPAVCFA